MKYLVFDTETGGFSSESNALISVGAILLDDKLQEIGSYYTLLKNESEKEASEGAEKVHGITKEMFENAVSPTHFKVLWNWFLIPQTDVLIAHNILFDKGFMEANDFHTIPKTLDTMHVAWDIWQGQKAKLGMVYERIGKEVEDAHNALYDCQMTAEFLRWAVENEHLELPLPSYPVIENYYEHKAFGYKKAKEKGLFGA